MDKTYDPQAIEQKWYGYWLENKLFTPEMSAEAPGADLSGDHSNYCIMLPPPNVTGHLHIGHAFQDTVMDLLTRYHRMKGQPTLWQCGTDHAGIATQMVVERQLGAQGKSRHDLGREAFVDAVWDWKAQSGGNIRQQMQRLGTAVDWDNERFTMDEGLSEAVMEVFVRLHDEGLIYRGQRLVNWDPVLHTALSDLEVINSEEQGHLWHIRYPRCDGKGHVVVATTRPETMLGDTAVAVHPDDERYQDLVGLELELPLTDRRIPVVADDYVDPAFGSGCVKITPAHDFNDWDVGQRNNLDVINILNDDASLNDNVPPKYQGLDRVVARKQVVADLETAGLLQQTEKHQMAVPRGDRSGVVLEPYLTDQWFVKIEPLAKPAIDAVRNGDIRFVPENWQNTYFNWMENIQDWCISRQLWWGHRIPAWYDDQGNIYVARNEDEVRSKHKLGADTKLRQDDDVLDTWFSAALWPFSTLGWPEKTDRLDSFYPTSVLVTGFDIIFFWVARMIMMGLKFTGKVPFRDVYIHGLIRDSQGQKMSKSKGNVLDPLDLIDGIELDALLKKRTTGLMQPQMQAAIEKATKRDYPDGIAGYGTDALRFTFGTLATQGRDMSIDMGRIQGYRNFCNKLWNAARFALMHLDDGVELSASIDNNTPAEQINQWIRSRLAVTVSEVRRHFDQYRFDLATQALYDFTWNEFCDWYLELSKPNLAEGADPAVRAATQLTLAEVLEQLLLLLHPVIPFITEEIWQRLRQPLQLTEHSVLQRAFPVAGQTNETAEAQVNWLKNIIQAARATRTELNLAPGKPLPLMLWSDQQASDEALVNDYLPWLQKLARIESITWLAKPETDQQCATARAGHMQLFIPLAGLIDVGAEIARLEKQQQKTEQTVKQLTGKLNNDKFVNNAPAAVVEKERTKLADAQSELDGIAEQLQQLISMQGG